MSDSQPPDSATRVLAISLRVCGGIDLLALIPFAMPVEWMRLGHAWCGFGSFPDAPIAEYLARATSLLWAMHGALLIYLSRNVQRDAAVVRFVALVTVAAGAGLLSLSLLTERPLWWTLLEGPFFAASGLWYLWWLRRISP